MPTHYRQILPLLVAALGCSPATTLASAEPVIEKLATGFRFTEGPALSPDGEFYFTDIPNQRIHVWSDSKGLRTFRDDSGHANGLMFDADGTLFLCEGGTRVLSMIAPDGTRSILAESYEGGRLNSPNDLWIDPNGGIYFTDPRYGKRDDLEQDGEHVYYLTPKRDQVIRVIDDMVRPNGLVGTPDGTTLFVADLGAKQTFRYTIAADGTLSDKSLFAEQGSDGMSMDAEGNLYLTFASVDVFSPDGTLLRRIELPERPANVIVIKNDPLTLVATARTSLYRITLPDGSSGGKTP